MAKYQVEFFQTEDGSAPALDFIESLGVKMAAKTYRLLELLAENGQDLREPYSKFLVDGIFELRVKFGSDDARMLYFFIIEKRIIVTNGFVKKTQKTPRSELAKAMGYRDEVLRREMKSYDKT